MVAVEQTFELPECEELSLVTRIWYNLSPDRSWWQRLFFRGAFLPFVRFAYRRMGIAAASAMLPDGTIIFRDVQGLYTDENAAEMLCRDGDEFWSHRPIPVDLPLAKENIQYKPKRRYPASTMPDRYRRRPFPITGASLSQVAALKHNLDRISNAANRQT